MYARLVCSRRIVSQANILVAGFVWYKRVKPDHDVLWSGRILAPRRRAPLYVCRISVLPVVFSQTRIVGGAEAAGASRVNATILYFQLHKMVT